ncbi:MAG TPA: sigma-70 family RNA polymerase sigma factor [Phycisphaerae bacterium]
MSSHNSRFRAQRRTLDAPSRRAWLNRKRSQPSRLTRRQCVRRGKLVRRINRTASQLPVRVPERLQALIEPDDVLQESWLPITEHLDELAWLSERRLRAWLRSVVDHTRRHVIRDAWRAKRGGSSAPGVPGDTTTGVCDADAHAPAASDGADEPAAPACDLLKALVLAEDLSRLELALSQLPLREQGFIRLHYLFFQRSIPWLAERTGVSESTVKNYTHSGLVRLRDMLGAELSDHRGRVSRRVRR